MRTTYITKPKEINRKWYVVDATDHTLCRLASEIAKVLRGKHKPIFAPHVDAGDYVIVTNATKIKVTGRKLDQKLYRRHTGHTGGLKTTTLKDMLKTKPETVIKLAVRGMLPKAALGKDMLSKLRVFRDDNHTHQAQVPEVLKLNY